MLHHERKANLGERSYCDKKINNQNTNARIRDTLHTMKELRTGYNISWNIANILRLIRSRSNKLIHVETCDREQSKVPVQKFLIFMSKNRKHGRNVKKSLKQIIRGSSSCHNLLFVQYCKYILERQTRARQFLRLLYLKRMPSSLRKMKISQKFCMESIPTRLG